jgi:hypothetical protein
MNSSAVLNAVGLVVLAMYIPLTELAVSIFHCYDSVPEDKQVRSLVDYPDVLCFPNPSPEWEEMLPWGIFGLGFYGVGIFAVSVRMIYVAPRRFQDEGFRTGSSFLFGDWNPDRWWWSLVLMLRGQALALIPVAFASLPLVQIFLTCFVFLTVLVFQVVFMPFKLEAVNWLDIMLTVALVYLNLLGAAVIPDAEIREGTLKVVSVLGILVFSLAWIPTSVLLVHSALSAYRFDKYRAQMDRRCEEDSFSLGLVAQRLSLIPFSHLSGWIRQLTEKEQRMLRKP